MVTNPIELERRILADFHGALYMGELLLAGGVKIDVFPDELTELATVFFQLFRPTAQA